MPAAVSTESNASNRLVQRLRSGGVWVVAGRTAGMATVLGTFMYLTRVATPSDFAAYVLTISIVSLFSMAAMFGLNTLVCRYISESLGVGDVDRAGLAMTQIIRLGSVSVCIVGGLGYLVLKFGGNALFHMPLLSDHAGLISLWIVLLAISQLVAEAFRGLHDLRMAGILAGVSGGLFSNLLFLIGMVVASLFGNIDYYSMVVVSIIALLIASIVSSVYLARVWQRNTSQEVGEPTSAHLSFGAVFREAWPVMLTQAFGFGLAQLDIWVVGICCSEADLAVYAVARRLSLLVAVPLTQVSMAISSSIAELHARGDRHNLQRVVRGGATLSAACAGLPMLGLVLFPGLCLGTIFDESYIIGAQTLRILLLGQMVFALTGPCGPTLMMTGHQRVSLWSLLSVLPVFAIAPWAANFFGLEGVAVVFTVALTLQNLIQWIVVARLVGITTGPCFSPVYISRLIKA